MKLSYVNISYPYCNYIINQSQAGITGIQYWLSGQNAPPPLPPYPHYPHSARHLSLSLHLSHQLLFCLTTHAVSLSAHSKELDKPIHKKGLHQIRVASAHEMGKCFRMEYKSGKRPECFLDPYQ